MGTPNERLILTNLASVISNITVANGYKTTIGTVSLEAMDWATAKQVGNFPFICTFSGRSTCTYPYNQTMHVLMGVQIIAHITAATTADGYDHISDLIDDIIAATEADTTRGGNAIWTKIIGWQDDRSDPDKLHGAQGGTCSVVIDLEIAYQRTTAST